MAIAMQCNDHTMTLGEMIKLHCYTDDVSLSSAVLNMWYSLRAAPPRWGPESTHETARPLNGSARKALRHVRDPVVFKD